MSVSLYPHLTQPPSAKKPQPSEPSGAQHAHISSCFETLSLELCSMEAPSSSPVRWLFHHVGKGSLTSIMHLCRCFSFLVTLFSMSVCGTKDWHKTFLFVFVASFSKSLRCWKFWWQYPFWNYSKFWLNRSFEIFWLLPLSLYCFIRNGCQWGYYRSQEWPCLNISWASLSEIMEEIFSKYWDHGLNIFKN